MPVYDWYLGCYAAIPPGDSSRAVHEVWLDMEGSLRPAARRISFDSDMEEDLLQEALIELWIIDPTRFDLNDPEEIRFLRRMLVNRMWDVWRSNANRLMAQMGIAR